jgi:hypothetical protein
MTRAAAIYFRIIRLLKISKGRKCPGNSFSSEMSVVSTKAGLLSDEQTQFRHRSGVLSTKSYGKLEGCPEAPARPFDAAL